MFSGIIESLGTVKDIRKDQENLHFEIECDFTNELKIDQSIAHNGACLTVIAINGARYTVTAIKETLDKTSLGQLSIGDCVNLERCIRLQDRLDGHIVQGHVDTTARVENVQEADGSTEISFSYRSNEFFTVPKGSICVNGVSLTVANSGDQEFSVAVIPFTLEHTNLGQLKPGSLVNLEFDIIGKYITTIAQKGGQL